MKRLLILLSLLFLPQLGYGFSDGESIFAIESKNGKREVKTFSGIYSSSLNNAIDSQQVEQLQYRNYVILLNRVSNGEYEVQVYKFVRYGSKQVNSIFASQFQASVEYAYSYESSTGRIRRDHFLFPPNSLTGWANPTDFVTMKEFAWKEPFPAKTCTRETHTSEEYGREYLEASCFKERDSALRFGKKFIDYVLGSRGM